MCLSYDSSNIRSVPVTCITWAYDSNRYSLSFYSSTEFNQASMLYRDTEMDR